MNGSKIYMAAPNGHINKKKLTIIVQQKYYIRATVRTCLNSLLIIDWYRNLKYGLIDATPEFKIWSKNVARSIHISHSASGYTKIFSVSPPAHLSIFTNKTY